MIAQVRFPVLASVSSPEFVAAFQEAIRDQYCILEPQQLRSIKLTMTGAVEGPATTNWRFHDQARAWRVTLAADFLALETTAYTSREEFIARFATLARALQEHIDPKLVTRLGLRYVDRVEGAEFAEVARLVRPEITGVIGTELAHRATFALSDNLFSLDGESRKLRARWGNLPANLTIDPGAVEPIPRPSWVLDLDAFVEQEQALDDVEIVKQTRFLADRAYAFFRWAVSPEFLRRFGGQP